MKISWGKTDQKEWLQKYHTLAVYGLSQNCLPIENRHVPTAKETLR
jgi:hypothetical protein